MKYAIVCLCMALAGSLWTLFCAWQANRRLKRLKEAVEADQAKIAEARQLLGRVRREPDFTTELDDQRQWNYEARVPRALRED